MGRSYDSQDDMVGTVVTRKYRLGGMGERNSVELAGNMTEIDGVKDVTVDQGTNKVTIKFDPSMVSEDHLVSTLNSLGHSILENLPETDYHES